MLFFEVRTERELVRSEVGSSVRWAAEVAQACGIDSRKAPRPDGPQCCAGLSLVLFHLEDGFCR